MVMDSPVANLTLWPHHAHTLPAPPWHPRQHPAEAISPASLGPNCSALHQAPALTHLSRQPLRGPPGQTPRLVSKPGPQLPPHRVTWGLCPPSLHPLLNAVTVLSLQGCLPQSWPPSCCARAPAHPIPLPPKSKAILTPFHMELSGQHRAGSMMETGIAGGEHVCHLAWENAGGCVSSEPWGQAISLQMPCHCWCLGYGGKSHSGDG